MKVASIAELERDWTWDQIDIAHRIIDAFEEAEEEAAKKAERERGRR